MAQDNGVGRHVEALDTAGVSLFPVDIHRARIGKFGCKRLGGGFAREVKACERQTRPFGPHPDDPAGRQVLAARQLLRPALHKGQAFGFVRVGLRHIDQERVAFPFVELLLYSAHSKNRTYRGRSGSPSAAQRRRRDSLVNTPNVCFFGIMSDLRPTADGGAGSSTVLLLTRRRTLATSRRIANGGPAARLQQATVCIDSKLDPDQISRADLR